MSFKEIKIYNAFDIKEEELTLIKALAKSTELLSVFHWLEELELEDDFELELSLDCYKGEDETEEEVSFLSFFDPSFLWS